MGDRRILFMVVLSVLTSLTGCPVRSAGTPKEELQRLGARIETLDQGAVRVSLRGKDATVIELSAVMALCSNHPEFRELRELDLSRSKVADDGLAYLQQNVSSIRTLKTLDLSETEVSDEAVAALQVALPDCRIVR